MQGALAFLLAALNDEANNYDSNREFLTHVRVMRRLLVDFGKEYSSAIQQSVLEPSKDVESFWKAIQSLNMCDIVKADLINSLKKFLYIPSLSRCHDDSEILDLSLKRLSSLGLNAFSEDFQKAFTECFCRVQAKYVFDYLMDFPESTTSIVVLREASANTVHVQDICDIFLESCEARLFSAAVSTEDILSNIIVCAEPLRLLDPTGYMLDCLLRRTSEAIKYDLDPSFPMSFRLRQGNMKEVIKLFLNLSSDPESGMCEEFKTMGEIRFDADAAICFDPLPDGWLPDPFFAPTPVKLSSKVGNSFTILANLFDSANEFISDYSSWLCDRLISLSPISHDEILLEFERLKAKIPSSSWDRCNVMLRDFFESRKTAPNTLIISHLYWPPFEGLSPSTMKIPSSESAFIENHPQRHITWHPELFKCQIAIVFGEDEVDFECSWSELLVIQKFASNPLGINDPALIPDGLDLSAVLECLDFWMKKRVLEWHGEDGTLALASQFNHDNEFADVQFARLLQTKENPLSPPSLSNPSESPCKKYWPYIEAMLRNLGALPLDRIQSNLSLFASDYKGSPSELQEYLTELTLSSRLALGPSGNYSLPE